MTVPTKPKRIRDGRRSAAQKAATARGKMNDKARAALKADFCRMVAEHFTMTKACKSMEPPLSRNTVARWEKDDPAFVAARNDAIEEYVDGVEQTLADLASGKNTDMKAVQVKALMAFLNAHRKNKYTYLSRHEVTGKDGKDLVLEVKLPEGFGQ